MGPEGWVDTVKVHGGMMLVGAGYGGYNVLTNVALTGGVDPFVFSTYRDAIGCMVVFLYALYFERQHWRKMSVEVAGLVLALAFLGVYLQQALFLYGLRYTNAVFSALVMNCIPVWSFLIAALFGIEEVAFHRRDGQAKVLGILCCVSGATILTLYKGPAMLGELATPSRGATVSLGAFTSLLQGWEIDRWRLGSLLLIVNSFCCAAFINLQVPVLKRFPLPFTLTSITVLLGGIMFATTTFVRLKSEPSKWILPPGPDLIAATYAGLVASGFCLLLLFWTNHKKGPVFVSAYTPIAPIFATIFGILFLGDALFLGSIIGALAIFAGLFLVLWGIQENLGLATLSLQIPTHGEYSLDAAQPISPWSSHYLYNFVLHGAPEKYLIALHIGACGFLYGGILIAVIGYPESAMRYSSVPK